MDLIFFIINSGLDIIILILLLKIASILDKMVQDE